MLESVCYCSNTNGLFESIGADHHPTKRLFIDSSRANLKAVLLHNEGEMPSVPLVHAVGIKETFITTEMIWHLIKYCKYHWSIGGDLKVIGFLLDMHMEYVNH